MANYQVTYQVNVLTENAIKSIEAFTAATKQLTNAAQPFRKVSQALNKLKNQMDGLSKKAPTIQIKTSQAEQRINRLLGKLRQLKKEANLVASVMPGVAPAVGAKPAGKAPRPTTAAAAAPPPATRPYASAYAATSPYRNAGRVRSIWPNRPKDIVYKTFGPTQLTANGGMAIDMLKGMGIAYGIAGIGTLFNNILNDSVTYDNTMKTVENILKSHDKMDDFAGRFMMMQRTVRDVGMETKFKVTEVADAAKFLAMAGLNVDAIRNAIRPIADIALVGDTDLGQTADLLTNIMTAYNIVPEKMRNAADVMVNTFTMSNTTLTEIAEAYKYSASLLSAADVPFEHSAAAIGILGNAGIKGSQAGTTLRTIMGNIANPTKKQFAAWKKVGVTPGKGNDRKDLIEIFNELGQKNIDISMFYQMFHKTAAAGAVALVKHVQEWNEIIAENFLSQGMAKRLADEKKNTIQGLWAQLTSVFQDNGVTAFAKVDGVIRNALRTGIEWLKSGEAKKAFDEAFKVFIQFGKIMADVTKWFKWLFDHFGGFIVMWAKFKLYIWPIVSAFNAMRVALHGLMFIKNISLAVRGLGASMMSLRTQMAWFGTGNAGVSGANGFIPFPYLPNAGISWLPGLTAKQATKLKNKYNLANYRPHYFANLGTVDNPDHWIETKNGGLMAWSGAKRTSPWKFWKKDKETWRKEYKSAARAYARHQARMQVWNGIKGAVPMVGGTIAMGAAMHSFTRDDKNTWDNWAGAGYSLAGLGFMMGSMPLAIGAAVAATAALVQASSVRSTEALQDMYKTIESVQTANGVLVNSENKIQQALDQVYNRHNDINTLVANRISMMKELLGLTPKEEAPADTTTSVYDKLMADWDKVWGSDAHDFVNKANAIDRYGTYLVDEFWRPGVKDKVRINRSNREGLVRSMAATTELMTGGYYDKTIGSMNARINQLGLTRGVTKETFDTYFESLAKTHDPNQISGLIRWENATDMNEKWDAARILKDWDARRVVWQNMQEVLKPIQEAVNAYMTEYAAGKLTDSTLARYMTYTNMGNEVGTAMQNYSPANTGDWFRTFGYYNNAFHDMSVYNTQTKMYEFATAEEMAKITVGNMQRVTEAIKTMGLASDPAGIALTNNANLLLTTAQAFLETEGKLEDIAGKSDLVINGLHWQYDATDKMWYQLAEDGSFVMVQTTLQNFTDSVWGLGSTLGSFNWAQYWANMLPPALRPLVNNNKTLFNTPQTGALGAVSNTVRNAFGLPSNGKASKTKSSMTPQQMANAYAASQKNKTNDNGNPIVADDPGSKKKEKGHEGYKSRYGSNTAAPKQVIVNINNLLCVEKIDLSNPDNVEVINNLKEQLAQALIDVVHNFDDTWHG